MTSKIEHPQLHYYLKDSLRTELNNPKGLIPVLSIADCGK